MAYDEDLADRLERLLSEPGAHEMQGRAVTGWLRVSADAVSNDDALRTWVQRGLAYCESLPPK